MALLREVCAAVLATGECDPELAGWCLRMLTEPGAAERAVAAVAKSVGAAEDDGRMSRDAEDDDHTAFMSFEGLRARGADNDAVLSRAAFMMHGFGMRNSIAYGDPGFVSDEYLNDVSAETSITATELCTAGLWARVDGGYEILDDAMIEMTLNSHIMVRRMDQCDKVLGGCRADEEDASRCGHCHAQMEVG